MHCVDGATGRGEYVEEHGGNQHDEFFLTGMEGQRKDGERVRK